MSYQAKDRVRYTRARWMEKFETACIKLRHSLRGKIDYGTGDYYYCKGYSPEAAAEAWVLKKEPA